MLRYIVAFFFIILITNTNANNKEKNYKCFEKHK